MTSQPKHWRQNYCSQLNDHPLVSLQQQWRKCRLKLLFLLIDPMHVNWKLWQKHPSQSFLIATRDAF